MLKLFALALGAVPFISFKKEILYAKSKDEKKSISKSNSKNESSFSAAPEKFTVLVIGETGTGKSTLINMMGNFFKNGKFEKPYICIPNKLYPKATERIYQHSEANVKNQSQAQTQKANSYIFNYENIKFEIIDTPGLNDPEGIEKDEKNFKIILDACEKAENLSAILLVVNGTEARITPNIQYIFTKLKGSIPDSITNNIVVAYTMCQKHSCNKTDFEDFDVEEDRIFHFNNTAFSSKPANNKDDLEMMEMEWKLSLKACRHLYEKVLELSPVATTEFSHVKKIRAIIKSTFQEARNKLNFLQTLNDQFEQNQKQLEVNQQELQNNSNYTIKKQVLKNELQSVNYHSTICANCNYVCHSGCRLNETGIKGDGIFSTCACMSNGYCVRCPEKCSYTQHYHDRKDMFQVMVDVDEEVAAIKAKYLAAQQGINDINSKISDLDLARQSMAQEIVQTQQDIMTKCQELKQICRNYNFTEEMGYLIQQLEKDMVNIRSVDARKQAETFVQQMKELSDSLSKEAV